MPHKKFFIYLDISSKGYTSKYDPLVNEVEILEANAKYADSCKSTDDTWEARRSFVQELVWWCLLCQTSGSPVLEYFDATKDVTVVERNASSQYIQFPASLQPYAETSTSIPVGLKPLRHFVQKYHKFPFIIRN